MIITARYNRGNSEIKKEMFALNTKYGIKEPDTPQNSLILWNQ